MPYNFQKLHLGDVDISAGVAQSDSGFRGPFVVLALYHTGTGVLLKKAYPLRHEEIGLSMEDLLMCKHVDTDDAVVAARDVAKVVQTCAARILYGRALKRTVHKVVRSFMGVVARKLLDNADYWLKLWR